jgi:hypothetical protein
MANSKPMEAAAYFEGRAKRARTREERERFLTVARRYRELAKDKESARRERHQEMDVRA